MCVAHDSLYVAQQNRAAAMEACAAYENKRFLLAHAGRAFPDAVDFRWLQNQWFPVFWGESRIPKVTR